jgi:DNA-binding LacI/PurR family transcriptional regulator
MAAKKRVTHQDVARAAGVSTAVVSYVVNNGPRPTSPEVRARVLKAISDLGYHPNAVARGLRARRTNTIGYIVNDYSPMDVFLSPYNAHVLTGLTAELKAREHYVLVYPMDVGEDVRSLERLLNSSRLDGLVIRLVDATPETDALLERIAATHLPCVCIEQPGAGRFGCSAVTYNDRRGSYDATAYLIAQGHRRIGHICGDRRYVTARARLAGYCDALADHGLPVDNTLIYGDDWDPVAARAGTMHMLALPAPPTALVVASDDLALKVIETLRMHHVRVPDDMAVIGFDDIPAGRDATPPLTTMRIPLVELGQRAADLLLEMIQAEHGAAMNRIETLPVELVRRGTA